MIGGELLGDEWWDLSDVSSEAAADGLRVADRRLAAYLRTMETMSPQDSELPDVARQTAETIRLGKLIGLDDDTLRVILDVPPVGSKAVASRALGDLTDAEWHQLKCFLPHNVLAAPGASPRLLLNALLFRARHHSMGWRSVPATYGEGDLLRQKFARWRSSNILGDLFAALPTLNLSDARRSELLEVARQVQAAEKRSGN